MLIILTVALAKCEASLVVKPGFHDKRMIMIAQWVFDHIVTRTYKITPKVGLSLIFLQNCLKNFFYFSMRVWSHNV